MGGGTSNDQGFWMDLAKRGAVVFGQKTNPTMFEGFSVSHHDKLRIAAWQRAMANIDPDWARY